MNTALQSSLQTGLGSSVFTGEGDAWIAASKIFFSFALQNPLLVECKEKT